MIKPKSNWKKIPSITKTNWKKYYTKKELKENCLYKNQLTETTIQKELKENNSYRNQLKENTIQKELKENYHTKTNLKKLLSLKKKTFTETT